MSKIGTPKEPTNKTNFAKCAFSKDGLEIILSFTPWLQEMFGITAQSRYI
jgi:hypothetical protein